MQFERDLERFLDHHPGAPAKAILATRLLMRAATLMRDRLDHALSAQGLTMREYLALAIISLNEEDSLRPSDLSVSLDATRTQITRLIDGLVAQGLVLRQPSAEDRRALHLRLSEIGRRRVASAAPAVHAAYQDAWGEAATLDPTLQALRGLNQRLQARAGSGDAA